MGSDPEDLTYLTTGSRRWSTRDIIHDALAHLTAADLIVNGGNGYYDQNERCWFGADRLVSQFGLVHSIPVKEYPVTNDDWKRIGLKAGPMRNERMFVEQDPDRLCVYAFRLQGRSNGTDHMMRFAVEHGVPVTLHYLTPERLVVETCSTWRDIRRILD